MQFYKKRQARKKKTGERAKEIGDKGIQKDKNIER